MPIFRVSGVDAAGEPFARARFEGEDEAAVRAGLTPHGVTVEEVRRVALTRWPFVRRSWPILAWPAFGLLALMALGRVAGVVQVVLLSRAERPLYEQLVRGGEVGEAEVTAVEGAEGRPPRRVEYRFTAPRGVTVTGVMTRAPSSIRARRFDLALRGDATPAPKVGDRMAVTYVPATPEVHVPQRLGPDALAALDAAMPGLLLGGVVALLGGVAALWMVRNTLLRLGRHYWMDDSGTVLQYAGRHPVTLRVDLENERALRENPEDE